MVQRKIAKVAPGLLLGGLAACALMMSGAFFLHARHAATRQIEAAVVQGQALPGITLNDSRPIGSGLIVTSMESDGQAARLGIAVGDGVVSLNGTPISSLDQASAWLYHHPQPRVALGLKHADRMRVVMLTRPEGE